MVPDFPFLPIAKTDVMELRRNGPCACATGCRRQLRLAVILLITICHVTVAQYQYQLSWHNPLWADQITNVAHTSYINVQPQYATCGHPDSNNHTYRINGTQLQSCIWDCHGPRRYPDKGENITFENITPWSEIGGPLWNLGCDKNLGNSMRSFRRKRQGSQQPACFLLQYTMNNGFQRSTHVFEMKYTNNKLRGATVVHISRTTLFRLTLTGNTLRLYSNGDISVYSNVVTVNRWYKVAIQAVEDSNPSLFLDGVYQRPTTHEQDISFLSRTKRQADWSPYPFVVSIGIQSSGILNEQLNSSQVLSIPACRNIGFNALVTLQYANASVGSQEALIQNIFSASGPTSIYNCRNMDRDALTQFACAFYMRPVEYSGRNVCRSFCQQVVSACGSSLVGVPLLNQLNCSSSIFQDASAPDCIDANYIPDFGIFLGEVKNFGSYNDVLTNREISQLFSFPSEHNLNSTSGDDVCLCPPQQPAISHIDSRYCVSNYRNDQEIPLDSTEVPFTSSPLQQLISAQIPELRVGGDSRMHRPEMAIDLDPESFWVSSAGVNRLSYNIVFNDYYQVLGVTFVLYTGFPRANTSDPGLRDMEIALLDGDGYRTVYYMHTDCDYVQSGDIPSLQLYDFPSYVPCIYPFVSTYIGQPQLPTIGNITPEAYSADFLYGKADFYTDTTMDVELLTFLNAGGLRLTFNGLPRSRGYQNWISTSQIISNITIHARRFEDRILCDCYGPGTDPTRQCNDTGQCPCRMDTGDPRHANKHCEPYVQNIFPSYGPVAGQTKLIIHGGYFGNFSSASEAALHIQVTFGISGLSCQNMTANATFIICYSPALNRSVPELDRLVDQPLLIKIQLSSGFQISHERFNFTYKPDPQIVDIQPLSSFLGGGIVQTVVGQDLNSVAVPIMTLTVWSNGVLYPQDDSICTVINNTVMHCPAPRINWDEIQNRGRRDLRQITSEDTADSTFFRRARSLVTNLLSWSGADYPEYVNNMQDISLQHGEISISRDRFKRQSSGPTSVLNSDYIQFYIGFKLDGVPTYRNVSEALGPGVGIIEIYHDPDFEEWDPEVQEFRPFEGDKFIDINGDRLNFGAQLPDYLVEISGSTCDVLEVNTNKLICRPPQKQPKHDRFSRGDANRVILKVGKITVQVGYLQYYSSLWGVPSTRAAVIATLVIVGIIVLALVITWFVLKRLYGDPIAHLRRRFNYKATDTDANSYDERPRRLLDMLQPELRTKIVECLIEPHTRMKLGHEVGKGNFGKVFSGLLAMPGQAQPVDCAIKTLKDESNNDKELREFLEEATIMKDFKHENVLSLYGVVILQNKPHVVLPFMAYGDLRGYVNNPRNSFTVEELLQYCLQVAHGMEYLSGMKFVHRDLAARNCMVDDKKVVKIADFGLARDIHERDYYAVEDRRRPMPIKWMAPECLDTFKFDSKSDVWSYSVTVWEVMMRGRKPYADVDNLDMKRYLQRGGRLAKPTFCPDPIYQLQLQCWHLNPNQRPTFAEVVQIMTRIMEKLQGPPDSPAQRPRSETNREYLEMVRMSHPGPGGLMADVPAQRRNSGNYVTGGSEPQGDTSGLVNKAPSERYTRSPCGPSGEDPTYLKPVTDLSPEERAKDEQEGYAGLRRPSQDTARYAKLSQLVNLSEDGEVDVVEPMGQNNNLASSPPGGYLAPVEAGASQGADGYLPPTTVQEPNAKVDIHNNTVNYTNL